MFHAAKVRQFPEPCVTHFSGEFIKNGENLYIDLLFSEVAGLDTEVVLDVATEMGKRGKTEEVGNVGEGVSEFRTSFANLYLFAQQAADVECRITRNPVVGGQAAYFLRDFGQVFGRDAKSVGVVADFAVSSEFALFQHLYELLHELVILRRDAVCAVELGMEVEEVQNHALYGILHGIAVETMGCLLQSALDVVEVQGTNLLLVGCQAHNGILEKRQMTTHSIVCLWSGDFDESLGHVDDIHPEIITLHEIPDEVAPTRHYQTIACFEAKLPASVLEGTESRMAIGMTEIVGKLAVGYVPERIVDNDVLYSVHRLISNEYLPAVLEAETRFHGLQRQFILLSQ